MKSLDSEVMYLLKDYNGLPAGTPVVRTEPTTAHLQARASVGTPEPSSYYCVLGKEEGEDVFMVPSFGMLVGKLHPTDPRRVGPYVAKEGDREDEDRLPEHLVAKVVWERDYPFMRPAVILNDKPSVDADTLRICEPGVKLVGYEEMVQQLRDQIAKRFEFIDEFKVEEVANW